MFEIFVSQKAYSKMYTMLDLMPKEIGALMIGEIIDGNAYVHDVVITKQEVTLTHIDFDREGVDMATLEAMMDDKVIIGWFHSHVNAGVFWSNIDENTRFKLLDHTDTYIVSIVANKRLEFRGCFDYIGNTPFGKEKRCKDEIRIKILPDTDTDYAAEVQHAIDTLVTEKVFEPLDHSRLMTYDIETADNDQKMLDQLWFGDKHDNV